MSAGTKNKVGKHAVVLGSSIAGLLAGRILSEHFERVTIVERDALKDTPEARKGAPQSRHTHVLLAKGATILAQLFPGFFEEIVESGSICAEMADACWFHFGHWKVRARTGVPAYLQSRELLEWKVRQRVKALENVEFLDQRSAVNYLTTPDRSRITGLRLRRLGGETETEESLEGADLVVDASGRGSQAPRWLEQLGYARVEETLIKVDLGYTSRTFQRSPDSNRDWKIMAIYPKPPEQRAFGYLSPIENDRWIVSLGGWLNEHAPMDDAGFLDFARRLPRPDIYETIKDAQPLSPLVVHKFPGSQRRHFNRMERFPEGLVVMGDALCSISPVYGQGMTIAALEAMMLDESLSQHGRDAAQHYRRKVDSVLELPWRMGTGEDLRYPEATGPRPAGLGLQHWYANKINELAAHDPSVVQGFVKVMHMLDSPAVLATPSILLRVLTSRPPADSTSATVRPPAPAA